MADSEGAPKRIEVGIEDEDFAQLIIDIRKRNEARLRLSKMSESEKARLFERPAKKNPKSKAKPKD